jgi:hypothetical protein
MPRDLIHEHAPQSRASGKIGNFPAIFAGKARSVVVQMTQPAGQCGTAAITR